MNRKFIALIPLMFFILFVNCSSTFGQFAGNVLKFRINDFRKTDNSLNLKMNSRLKKNDLKNNSDTDTSELFGSYTPNAGFRLVDTKDGTVNFSVFSYIRYLNQKGIDSTYTDAFGKTTNIKTRQDIQLNKVNIKFFGWIMDPRFRYLFYVWTSNTSLGQVSQVVVAGNIQYKVSKYFNFGAGINGLPGVRSTSGNFPFWLPVDNRMISDEYFRPSYTTGLWADGNPAKAVEYNLMWGNNLSQFGIDAGQLDAGLNTFSGMVRWFPTTGEFGLRSDFGDFEDHKKAATMIAGHFTYSEEDRESQPKTDEFENVQLRVSDGSKIFTSGLFGENVNIKNAVYKMTALDAGVKYKGFALEGEFYWRWLSNFTGDNMDSLGFNLLSDNGFQAMISYMIVQQRLQVYSTFSQVFGEYGNPWDARFGFNFFPFKNQAFRWNFEYIQIYRSPVGSLSVPYPVGGTGGIFNTDFMVNF